MPSLFEKRIEPRVPFTHLSTDNNTRLTAQGWAFGAAAEQPPVQAWVLDISSGGMQVLAPKGSPPRSPNIAYDAMVLGGTDPQARLRARVWWVWSREVAHLGQLNGFEFEVLQPQAVSLLAGPLGKRTEDRGWPLFQLLEPARPPSLWAWARMALTGAQPTHSGAQHETH